MKLHCDLTMDLPFGPLRVKRDLKIFALPTASLCESHRKDWKGGLWKEREAEVSHDLTLPMFWLQAHPLLARTLFKNYFSPVTSSRWCFLWFSGLRFTVCIVFSIFYTTNIGIIKKENTRNYLQLRLPVFLFAGSTCSISPWLNPRLLEQALKGEQFRGRLQRHGRNVPQPYERERK